MNGSFRLLWFFSTLHHLMIVGGGVDVLIVRNFKSSHRWNITQFIIMNGTSRSFLFYKQNAYKMKSFHACVSSQISHISIIFEFDVWRQHKYWTLLKQQKSINWRQRVRTKAWSWNMAKMNAFIVSSSSPIHRLPSTSSWSGVTLWKLL